MRKPVQDIDQLFRTTTVVWFVLLMSQFALYGLAWTLRGNVAAPNPGQGFLGEYPPVILGAALLAVCNLAISFFVRKRANEQAIADQNVKHVQTGLIVACALCESISIIGMVLAVAFSYPYFYLWFVLGIFGIFLHFPRRKHMLDASGARTASP
jgi:F0F1-type ATP synthase membrane subunit c/vacuolar-type H+-ATPase subunit K